ncbi:hypothetical protein Tco_0845214 [Tanacetum coccineum]
MAAPGPANFVARRVVDDLIDFSGEAVVPKFMKLFFVQQFADIHGFASRMRKEVYIARNNIAQLTALVAEIKAMGDQEEVFDTLMCLRDDIWKENTKLLELNGVIVQAKERIAMKEEHVKVMEAAGDDVFRMLILNGSVGQDKMKVLFSRARNEDESFIGLMRELCSGLRLSLNKNQRLIAELEALGQRRDALRCLEYMREMVVRDSAMLGVLEQLLASTHVGMRLKAGCATDMDEAEIFVIGEFEYATDAFLFVVLQFGWLPFADLVNAIRGSWRVGFKAMFANPCSGVLWVIQQNCKYSGISFSDNHAVAFLGSSVYLGTRLGTDVVVQDFQLRLC